MIEDEFDDITTSEIRGIFLYGCHKLQLNAHGLIPGAHDPDDLATVGTLCILINRLTHENDNPFDGTICALAVLAAALLAADETGLPMPHLVGKWHKTLATANKLQLAGMDE